MQRLKKGITVFRITITGLFALVMASGCTHVRSIPVPEEGAWQTLGPNPDRMYVRHDEGRYVIRDEPYSIKSKKKDPELLGPQRTSTTAVASTSTPQTPHASSTTAPTMTKSDCISMIGETKFNQYVQKYGGEKGALRRCLILKRIRG